MGIRLNLLPCGLGSSLLFFTDGGAAALGNTGVNLRANRVKVENP